MKILHVVPSYFPAVRYGGPIYSVHGLAAGQAALGHHVSVFTTNADGPGVSDVPVGTPVSMHGVDVTYFQTSMPRRLYRAPAMGRALRAQADTFDIIHLHSVFLWPTLAAARAAAGVATPYILSPRGMLVPALIRAKSRRLKTGWLALFERKTIAQAAAIHFTADHEAADFAALGLRAAHQIVIPNGVDPPRIATTQIAPDVANVTATPGYALYLGRLNWKKNLLALIEALAPIPAMRLVLAGTDDEHHAATLHAAIAAANLSHRITVIDRTVADADKEALFDGCAMVVLPSLNENFGNTVLEAMVRSKPVVVSTGAGVAEVVRDADCGLPAAPSAPALGAAIQALAADPDAAAAMGARGRRAALDHFGWPAIAARMIEAYERIVQGDTRMP